MPARNNRIPTRKALKPLLNAQPSAHIHSKMASKQFLAFILVAMVATACKLLPQLPCFLLQGDQRSINP